MRKGLLLGSLAAFLVGSGVCRAQTTPDFLPPPPTSVKPPPAIVTPPPASVTVMPGSPGPLADCFAPPNASCGYRTWGGVEYLLWRFNSSPLPDPLVNSGGFKPPAPPPPPPPANGGGGGEEDPVVFGGHGYSAGWQSGFRLTFGAWIDNERQYGFEASGFYMVPRTPTNFSMGATNPSQVLAIPFNNVTPGGGSGGVAPGVIGTNASGQTAFLISGGTSPFSGNPMTGSIAISSFNSLWGAELNGVANLYRTNRIEVNLLGGFRYADLTEDLYINTQTNDPTLGSLSPATFADHFGTRNQFYGGQLGLKGEWSNGVFFVNASGKVALGVNHETVSVDGSFADPGPVFLNNFSVGQGGLFAQRSNIGQYSRNRFMALPEGQLQAGVNLNSNVRLFAGYDFMYMSSVVRPGNQIDNNINLSQVGANANHGPNTLVGQASPGVPFGTSSFWAQGITFGVTFRY
jgi:Putative beta barrel porin-7 (BBP7)